MISVGRIGASGSSRPSQPARSLPAPSFEVALERLLDPPEEDAALDDEAEAEEGVRLSRRAIARLAARDRLLGEADDQVLNAALDTLQGRGAHKALVLTSDDAWIVGVPQRIVVDAMSRAEALGQIFIDLDSTYVAS